MASWLESALGGAFEGYNEVQDERRKEERANRMLEKELTLTRDFAIEDEKRLEDKAATENIKSLGLYYNPANTQRIVSAGTGAVSAALVRGKELQDLSKDPNNYLNPEYLEATSMGKVKYVGDTGWDGHVKGMITNLKQPKKVTRRKGADPIVAPIDVTTGKPVLPEKLPLFKPVSKELLTSKSLRTGWEEGMYEYYGQYVDAIGTDQEAIAREKYETYAKKAGPILANSPTETSKISQTTLYKDMENSFLKNSNFKSTIVKTALGEEIEWIIDGREGEFYAINYAGLSEIQKFSKITGHDVNITRSWLEKNENKRKATDHTVKKFNEAIKKDADNNNARYIEDGGHNSRMQHASRDELEDRMLKGQIPQGAVISWPDPDAPEYINISLYATYGVLVDSTTEQGTRVLASDVIGGQVAKFQNIYTWPKPKKNNE